MRKLTIKKSDLADAINPVCQSEDYPESAYLDLETGEVIWVFDEDQDAEDIVNIPAEQNRELRERIEADVTLVTTFSFFDDTDEDEDEQPEADEPKSRADDDDPPHRYLELTSDILEDDHVKIRRFLRSRWTDDEKLWDWAADAYHGSIGRWKREIDHHETVMKAWREYEDADAQRSIDEFLAEHGIEPVWK